MAFPEAELSQHYTPEALATLRVRYDEASEEGKSAFEAMVSASSQTNRAEWGRSEAQVLEDARAVVEE